MVSQIALTVGWQRVVRAGKDLASNDQKTYNSTFNNINSNLFPLLFQPFEKGKLLSYVRLKVLSSSHFTLMLQTRKHC
jgi:hypothetical protein